MILSNTFSWNERAVTFLWTFTFASTHDKHTPWLDGILSGEKQSLEIGQVVKKIRQNGRRSACLA